MNSVTNSPFHAALDHNRAELQREQEATQETLLGTIQTQQEGMSALQDRIALLEAQLEDSRRETARAIADLEAARVANAALARQSASQQEELAYLRPFESMMRSMVVAVDDMTQLKAEEWPENQIIPTQIRGLSPVGRSYVYETVERTKNENFTRTGTHIPTPAHWGPILEQIKSAKPLLKHFEENRSQRQLTRTAPIPIPTRFGNESCNTQ